MNTDPSIRRAEERDRKDIVDLFVTVNRELAPPGMEKEFETYIDLCLSQEIEPFLRYYDPALGNGLWVVVHEGALAGMYGLERVDIDVVELRRMYVGPDHRRQGMARLMLQHAEATAEQIGYRRMVLSTSELQQAALSMYRAQGFRFIREERAEDKSNKTIGGGIVRFHFDKKLGRGSDTP